MKNIDILNFAKFSYTRELSIPQDMGWKLLADSDDFGFTDTGFFAAVFVKNNNILVVNEGTSTGFRSFLDLRKDLWSDTQIAMANIPDQFTEGGDLFINKVLDVIPKNAVIYTVGHSLGAVLSMLENVKLTALGFDVRSINVESPGTKVIAQKYINNTNIDLDIKNLNAITYNMRPNEINTLNSELGQVYFCNQKLRLREEDTCFNVCSKQWEQDFFSQKCFATEKTLISFSHSLSGITDDMSNLNTESVVGCYLDSNDW